MNDKLLGFYDYVAVIAPGAALLFGLFFVSPELKAVFTAEGFSVGNFGLFVLVSYVVGQVVAAGGNLVEWAWWRPQGGMPSAWPTRDGRVLPDAQVPALEERLRRLPGCESVSVRSGDTASWGHALRAMASSVRSGGRGARLDLFNATYGMHRNLAAALIVLALVALVAPPHRLAVAACAALLAAAALARMHRFGVHYARELFVAFLGVPAEGAKAATPAEGKPPQELMTPKVVYLDSSDYSCLASAAEDPSYRDRGRWLAIRERLLAARADGRAIFRFSYPIVMEVYPTALEHRPQGIARARAIMEVNGSHCLLDFRALWAEEAFSLATCGRPPERTSAWRDDGAWHPNPDEFLRGMLRGLTEENTRSLRAMLRDETRLGRAERKRIERAMLRPDGTLTPAAAALVTPERRQELGALVAECLHLPPSPDDDLFARIMFGELPSSALGGRIASMLRDVRSLFQQEAVREHEGSLFHWIRNMGASLSEPLREGRRRMIEMVSEHGLPEVRRMATVSGGLPRWETWVSRTRSKILGAVWDWDQRRLRATRVDAGTWRETVVGSALGSLPALDAFLAAIRTHVLLSLQPSAQPRQPRDSDGGDLVHQLYLPYVDVFRCDGYAATVATRTVEDVGLRTSIARTIDDALEAIGA